MACHFLLVHFLPFLPVPFDIFHHQILSCELEVVGKVVYYLSFVEPATAPGIEDVASIPCGGPVDVPLIFLFFRLDPAPVVEVVDDHLLVKVGLPFEFTRVHKKK